VNKIFTAAVMSLRFDSYSKNEACNVYARKKAMEQQVEAVLVKSTTMKKVWRSKQVVSTSTGIEQAMADNCYRP